MNEFAQNPAAQRLIEALAERLVRDYLIEKTAPERENPARRPNHVDLHSPREAA